MKVLVFTILTDLQSLSALTEESTANRTKTGVGASSRQRESRSHHHGASPTYRYEPLSNAAGVDDDDPLAPYRASHGVERDEATLDVGRAVGSPAGRPRKDGEEDTSSSDDSATLLSLGGHVRDQKRQLLEDGSFERVQGSRTEAAVHSVDDNLFDGDRVEKKSYSAAVAHGIKASASIQHMQGGFTNKAAGGAASIDQTSEQVTLEEDILRRAWNTLTGANPPK